jgi:hypothetical protein
MRGQKALIIMAADEAILRADIGSLLRRPISPLPHPAPNKIIFHYKPYSYINTTD